MEEYYRSHAIVHLDAVVHNIQELRSRVPKESKIMAVVKADAYGHGMVPVAKTAAPYVEAFAVAMLEEAVNLRRHGIQKPILVLGVVPVGQYDQLFQFDIIPTVFQMDKAELLSQMAVDKGKTCPIHIALDTGMSRIGFSISSESVKTVLGISGLPGIEIEGLFTHYSKADESDKASAYSQLEKFNWFEEQLNENGLAIPLKHCSNSAGILDIPAGHRDIVRAGISMYGCLPSDQMLDQTTKLRQVLELKSHVSYLKTIEQGVEVSYGGTYSASRQTKVATIPVGYGDGFPRNQSGKGHVLICGQRADILGRVCMDQFMVDVTDIRDVKEGSVVTLIGRDGEEEITIEEIAAVGQAFHYELLCNIGKRVPRVYKYNEQIVGTKDHFSEIYKEF